MGERIEVPPEVAAEWAATLDEYEANLRRALGPPVAPIAAAHRERDEDGKPPD